MDEYDTRDINLTITLSQATFIIGQLKSCAENCCAKYGHTTENHLAIANFLEQQVKLQLIKAQLGKI